MITFDRIGHLGRLANQMFQYSTLFSIAHQNNYDFAIPSDNSKVIDSGGSPGCRINSEEEGSPLIIACGARAILISSIQREG